jgi:hypothetical protein
VEASWRRGAGELASGYVRKERWRMEPRHGEIMWCREGRVVVTEREQSE